MVASILFPPRCFCLRERRRLCEPIMGDHDSAAARVRSVQCAVREENQPFFFNLTHFPRTDASITILSIRTDENVMEAFSTMLPQILTVFR